MKSYIKKLLSFLLIMVMLLPISLPVISKAAESETTSRQEASIDVQLQRDETNPNIIHITATDTTYKITDLKYVHQYIETDNVDYFEEEHEKIYTFDITPAQTIQETFELEGYGSYTVYAKNERGDRFLARLTVNDPNDMPQITLTRNEENPLELTIHVTSKNNTITKLKIAKKQNLTDTIDFSREGTDIEFIQSKDVTVQYTEITEEGLYVIYAEDSEGNKTTTQIYLAEETTPIKASITDGSNPREVNIQITDALCNIVKVKVAKKSEITDFKDFETKGDTLSITEGKNVNITYVAPEDNTYVFYIEDEAGYKKMLEKRITSEEKTMQVSINQSSASPKELTIMATNAICNIVEMKIAIGNDIDMDYFKNNGEAIPIEPGREVVVNYTVNENCMINVYVKDEQGYSYLYKKQIIGIDEPDPEPNVPPEITLVQNTENLRQIDVTVSDQDSYIDEVKWARGSQTISYFANNGTRIGQGSVGSRVHTEFTINATGIYTVYARDEDGNEVVEEINITNIEEIPEEDTTPPVVNNVENGKIYTTSVRPEIIDENLSEIYLTRNGIDVENYQNGDIIDEEGEYVLNAVDVAGNEVVVKFIIDKTAPEITISQQNTDNENVVVTMNFTDNLTTIDTVKVANGNQDISYFENGGQELTLEKQDHTAKAMINVTKNGTYTIYVQDEGGNAKVETFQVTTIIEPPDIQDTTPPTIETTNAIEGENESVKVTIQVNDTQSQIETIKIASGSQNIAYFQNQGTTLQTIKEDKSAQAVVMITENGTYTIYAKDEKGNESIKVITISEIVIPEPEPEPDDTIISSIYEVTTTRINKISPNTDILTLKNNISTEIGYKVVNKEGEELGDTDRIGTGDKLITDTNKEYILIVTGDLNGDGNITPTDMSMIRKHYLGIENLQDEYLEAADMDNNDKISLNDISIMRKAILEID